MKSLLDTTQILSVIKAVENWRHTLTTCCVSGNGWPSPSTAARNRPAPTQLPASEEISRIRHLITRIKVDAADLNEAERAQMGEAVAVIRRHRATYAIPSVRPPL